MTKKLLSTFLPLLFCAELLLTSTLTHAVPVSIGSLVYDSDVSTEIVTDSLNNRQWLRWDVLPSLTYAETNALLAAGGLYSGWKIGHFSDAVLFGQAATSAIPGCQFATSLSCTAETTPNSALSAVMGITNVPYWWHQDMAFVLSDEYPGEIGTVYAAPSGDSLIFAADTRCWLKGVCVAFGDNLGQSRGSWLLYQETVTTNVPEPANLALFGTALMGMLLTRSKRRLRGKRGTTL